MSKKRKNEIMIDEKNDYDRWVSIRRRLEKDLLRNLKPNYYREILDIVGVCIVLIVTFITFSVINYYFGNAFFVLVVLSLSVIVIIRFNRRIGCGCL